MTITDLSQSVAALADAHRETMGLITRLRKLEGIGVDTTRAELVQLIHQSLKDTEQDLELLRIHIEDLPTGEQKTALTSKWHKLSEDTKIARVSYRKAQIEAKRSAEAARRQERELLLGKADGKRRLRGANQLSQDELVLNASTDITSSLKRTHALLSSELSRSQFASETLSQSTQALKELSTRYSTFDDMLLKSRRLITDLVRKNKSDAWYYEKAIYIMVITVVWLIIRRFLYGPLYLFVWLPLKLCWWTLSLFASMIGAGGSRDFDILPKSNNIPRNDGNDMAVNQPKVEVQGLPKDLHQIPKSILPEPIIVSEKGSEEASEEISKEVHGTPGVTAVTGAPAVPNPQRASDGIKMSEPDPVTDENSSYRESDPPPFKPFQENEPFLEQVGEALDKQREEARLKEHAPVLEMRHDEL